MHIEPRFISIGENAVVSRDEHVLRLCSLSNNFLEMKVIVKVTMLLFFCHRLHFTTCELALGIIKNLVNLYTVTSYDLMAVGSVNSDCFYLCRLAAPPCNAIYFDNQYFIVNSVTCRSSLLPYHSAPLTCLTFLARRRFLFIRSATKPHVLRLNLTIHSRTKSFREFFSRQRRSSSANNITARMTNLTTVKRATVFFVRRCDASTVTCYVFMTSIMTRHFVTPCCRRYSLLPSSGQQMRCNDRLGDERTDY